MNLETVKNSIIAYMRDATIKTAVVVNDPDNWNDTAQFFDDLKHEFTMLLRRGVDNKNIIVFVYPDISIGNFYTSERGKKLLADFPENERYGRINIIEIPCPNAAELRNMLMYFRINRGLKIRPSELSEISLALKQAMKMKNMRIKSLYCELENYAKSGAIMNVDACYTMLGEKKPESAQEQLEHLIGMEDVKKVLSQYDVKNNKVSIFDYITASRLQPDKEFPNRNDEMIHFILTGNPGTGKTTVAKLIGQLFYEMGYLESGHVVETDRSQLVAGYVGQ
ncbi:AAA family ATPase, partial [bacterium]|nr:AAA family ATPase [bacterium]